MTNGLTPLDNVRMTDAHEVTGVYIGVGPDVAFPEVVRRDDDEHFNAYAPGTWEPVPDLVTISISREDRDLLAEGVSNTQTAWGRLTLAAKASKASEVAEA